MQRDPGRVPERRVPRIAHHADHVDHTAPRRPPPAASTASQPGRRRARTVAPASRSLWSPAGIAADRGRRRLGRAGSECASRRSSRGRAPVTGPFSIDDRRGPDPGRLCQCPARSRLPCSCRSAARVPPGGWLTKGRARRRGGPRRVALRRPGAISRSRTTKSVTLAAGATSAHNGTGRGTRGWEWGGRWKTA